MGCNNSTPSSPSSIVPVPGAPLLPGGPLRPSPKVAPAPELESAVDKAIEEEGPSKTVAPEPAETTPCPDYVTSADGAPRVPFPVPEGWRVVCRLSPGDVRSRWGSRPRPSISGETSSAAVGLEADLVSPEMTQPLRLPLQLLPVWSDPIPGTDFNGRYEVRRSFDRPGARGPVFEVFDKEAQSLYALQVVPFACELDVKFFVERFQIESLDTDSRLFLKLRDVALALPGRLAIIEEYPRSDLWTECQRDEWRPNLAARVADVANSVLSGLCRLHAHGRAHCAVSPLSVFLGADGAWKLSSLESARRVSEMHAVQGSTGTTVPPEAILGLPMTEKVDVWQLAVTLCEAIVQKRISDIIGGSYAPLLALVNFLGPLPEGLVERHPQREALFTPEGHVLRPVTPSAGEQFEAIEPEKPPVATADGGARRFPRPWPVVEALAGVEGADDIMEFLGHLLNPDPEQRPSAAEALAHHFLRFAHTKAAAKGGNRQVGNHKNQVGFQRESAYGSKHRGDNGNEGGCKIARKGTGFVHVGELPPSDDENEEDDKGEPRNAQNGHVAFKHTPASTKQAPDAGKITRKGTGFVHVGELPPSDDEDEEEAPAPKAKVRMAPAVGGSKAQDTGGKIARKGTGFVHVGELPPSDEEDEEDEDVPGVKQPGHVAFKEPPQKPKAVGVSLTRKGTGFVNVGELPPSDDEDEDDEEQPPKQKHVQIKASQQEKTAGSGLTRKGTGYVNAGELPQSDDEDEEEEEDPKPSAPKKVTMSTKAVDMASKKSVPSGEGKLTRKGTGFVNVGELPPSDDEDEDEEEEAPKAAKKVNYKDTNSSTGEKKTSGMTRKGTGFVTAGDLPNDEDEEEEDEEVVKHVEFKQEAQQPKDKLLSKPVRKGTGFVNAVDLPESDEDEDDEEEEQPRAAATGKTVDFSNDPAQLGKQAVVGVGKVQRKGTGFVHATDIVDTDEDDDEED